MTIKEHYNKTFQEWNTEIVPYLIAMLANLEKMSDAGETDAEEIDVKVVLDSLGLLASSFLEYQSCMNKFLRELTTNDDNSDAD